MLLPNLAAAATVTALQTNGANGNGTVLDLQLYKGPVTFALAVGHAPAAVNTEHVHLQTSADNTTWSNVTGGGFANVTNAANAANIGVQLKAFDVRDLSRYVRCPQNTSAANAQMQVLAIGQLERV